MARIRSVHPGLASDEAYMSMSMTAKAAWPLLWTECDDQGVFEWKPIVLKARIFPADNVDFSALLDEWVGLDCIKMIEVDGKPYGLVRNFLKYQRPKNPSIRHAIPESHMEYLGRKVQQSSDPATVLPQPSGSPTEIPPQMEDGGGNSIDDDDSARAREAVLHLDLSDSLLKLLGQDPKNPEPGYYDAPRTIQGWLNKGWDAETIAISVREQLARKRDGPPGTIRYFERGIASAIARHRAPLPVAKSPAFIEGSHAKKAQNTAIDGIRSLREKLVGSGASGLRDGPSGDDVRVLSEGGGQRS